jgi:hypothetical protein
VWESRINGDHLQREPYQRSGEGTTRWWVYQCLEFLGSFLLQPSDSIVFSDCSECAKCREVVMSTEYGEHRDEGRLVRSRMGPRRTVCKTKNPTLTRRKTVIYDCVYDCDFSHKGQVLAYMTGAHRSHCGPVIPDSQSYRTLKYFLIHFLPCLVIN